MHLNVGKNLHDPFFATQSTKKHILCIVVHCSMSTFLTTIIVHLGAPQCTIVHILLQYITLNGPLGASFYNDA